MNHNHSDRKSSALTTVVVCALVFICFSFFWLYNFQSDVLAVAQHRLSGGQTSYNRLIGSLLITLILMIIQHGVYGIVKLSRRTHALTYFPSFLILALLSTLDSNGVQNFSVGHWGWISLLLLVIWGLAVWVSRKILPFENDHKVNTGIFSRRLWVNMIQMALMMLMVAWVGNTNAVYHFRTHAEVALMRGDVDEALRVGIRSHETDVNLTMLRLYALSQRGMIGDSLFTYPVAGTSADMLPLHESRSRLLIYPKDSMWAHFGDYVPTRTMTVGQYFDSLAVDTTSTGAYIDYRLTGMLIDRKLEAFATALPNYYPLVPDSLPRHYREALVLYQNVASADTTQAVSGVTQALSDVTQAVSDVTQALSEYKDSVYANQMRHFQELEEAYPSAKERKLNVNEHFRQTYWYYYFYSK